MKHSDTHNIPIRSDSAGMGVTKARKARFWNHTGVFQRRGSRRYLNEEIQNTSKRNPLKSSKVSEFAFFVFSRQKLDPRPHLNFGTELLEGPQHQRHRGPLANESSRGHSSGIPKRCHDCRDTQGGSDTHNATRAAQDGQNTHKPNGAMEIRTRSMPSKFDSNRTAVGQTLGTWRGRTESRLKIQHKAPDGPRIPGRAERQAGQRVARKSSSSC